MHRKPGQKSDGFGVRIFRASIYQRKLLRVDRTAKCVIRVGGRFFEELRSRQSLAYQVSTFLVSRFYGGAFLAYIATSPENEEQAKNGLLKEFEKLITDPISEQELKQSIQYTAGTHQIGLETYRAQMVQFAHNELLGKGFEEVERFKKKIEKVTAENILEVSRKYFDLNRYAVGMIRGKKS